MQHNNKPFEESVHSKYDSQAKRLVKDIIKDLFPALTFSRENISEGNDFKEGIWDLEFIYKKDNTVRKVEAEIKNSSFWSDNSKYGPTHPLIFPAVTIPYRKKDNKSHVFFVISSDERFAFYVSQKFLFDSDVKTKPCRNYSIPEPYYNIIPDHVREARFCKKINNKWEWC